MDPTDFATEQLFLWIPVNVIRQSHRQIMNHWEHTIEIAALSIVTTQPSCFLEDQIWALLQGFGQGLMSLMTSRTTWDLPVPGPP